MAAPAAVAPSAPKSKSIAWDDGGYAKDLPPLPLHGTANAPIAELIAWHHEVLAADRACSDTVAAASAAVERRRIAVSRFVKLQAGYIGDKMIVEETAASSGAGGSGGKNMGKGKGKARASSDDDDDEDEAGDASVESEVEGEEDDPMGMS
jgi:hypothetical protein